MAYGTSYYAISLGTNIVLTILITVRLLLYRRNLIKRFPAEHAKHYVSLAAIIVESAALYSVFALIFLITYAVNDPVNQIFLGFASFTQVRSLLFSPRQKLLLKLLPTANLIVPYHLPSRRWSCFQQEHNYHVGERDVTYDRIFS